MKSQEQNQELTRDELLSKLKSISFAVFMTALPTEMCLEIETMTPEGTSYQWIGYDDWKVFVLRKCEQEKWNRIIAKIGSQTLVNEDIESTDLGKLANRLSENYDEPLCYSSLFNSLVELSPVIHETFYAYCEDENLRFFASKEELKTALGSTYSNVDTCWEDMDTEELRSWWERYEEEGDDLPAVFFDDESET